MEERLKAAALRYVAGDEAPQLLAAGQGPLAREILKLAAASGIPLFRDPNLLEGLLRLEVGEIIPPELYRAVAEVLAFIYRADVDRFGRTVASQPEPGRLAADRDPASVRREPENGATDY